jgi:hypothetical protein
MGTAAVLACVFELLGGPAANRPQIALLAHPPADVSVLADGFVRTGNSTIYLITSATAFRQADCNNRLSLLKLASVIAHEDWHLRNGTDERGAYEAQLATLLRLGVAPDSPLFRGVLRSEETALKAQAAALKRARDRAAKEARRKSAPPAVAIAAADVPLNR